MQTEFDSKVELHKHAKDVHGLEEKSHKCGHCFKSFPSSQQLTQHSLVHTNIRKYQCKFCDKTFKQLSHVQQHQRIHTGEKPYRCTMDSCEKAFAQLSNLQNHMKQHEKELHAPGGALSGRPGAGSEADGNGKKPYNCHLHTPLAQPHDLTCQVCEKQCFNTEKFYRHMHKYHPDYWRVFAGDRPLTDFINPEARPVKEKPFSCQLCHKKYSHETGLAKHLVTHPEFRNDPNFKDAEIFTCSVCDKIFTRENYLERHMEMKHDEEHARAYEIYKQKYVKKTPLILENSSAQHTLPPLAIPLPPPPPAPHSSSGGLPGSAGLLPHSALARHVRPYDPMGAMGGGGGGGRAETISRAPPDSPTDSELEERHLRDGRRAGPPSGDRNRRPALHSESFTSDTSFEKGSPPGRPSSQRDYGPPRWSYPNTPQESPHGFLDNAHPQQQQQQQQPFDMSQRQSAMHANSASSGAKSHSAPPSRGGSTSDSLPVFPDTFPSHAQQAHNAEHKDNNGGDVSPRSEHMDTQRLPMTRSYLHRQMADIDDHNGRQGSAAILPPPSGFLERAMSVPHDNQQASYEQFLRDQLLNESRGGGGGEEKMDTSYSHRAHGPSSNNAGGGGSREDIGRGSNEHYMRGGQLDSGREGGIPRSAAHDYYGRGVDDKESYRQQHQQQQDELLERQRLAKSVSLDEGALGRHDNGHQGALNRHFYGSPRSPGLSGVGLNDGRLLDGHDVSAPHRSVSHDESRFHDFATGYGAASQHLFSPGAPHPGLSRDRLGQFPFSMPPTSLPHSGLPHAMAQRPSLGPQYPPMPRSEEEIAQALETFARAIRPYR